MCFSSFSLTFTETNSRKNVISRSPRRLSPSFALTPLPSDKKRPRDDEDVDEKKRQNTDGKRSIYVGNLPFDIKRDELRQLCAKYGEVFQVTLGARGFGFVLMEARGAGMALEALDRRTFGGRILHVNEAFKEEK